MRLTLMTDYALRLLMHVGRQPQRLVTIAEVAQAQGLSQAHLMKITQQLAAAGLLETVRGKGGGMRLGAEPAAIGLGTVVRLTEPDWLLVECFGQASSCRMDAGCRLASAFDAALAAFLAELDRWTLADLLTSRMASPDVAPLGLPRPRRPRPAPAAHGGAV